MTSIKNNKIEAKKIVGSIQTETDLNLTEIVTFFIKNITLFKTNKEKLEIQEYIFLKKKNSITFFICLSDKLRSSMINKLVYQNKKTEINSFAKKYNSTITQDIEAAALFLEEESSEEILEADLSFWFKTEDKIIKILKNANIDIPGTKIAKKMEENPIKSKYLDIRKLDHEWEYCDFIKTNEKYFFDNKIFYINYFDLKNTENVFSMFLKYNKANMKQLSLRQPYKIIMFGTLLAYLRQMKYKKVILTKDKFYEEKRKAVTV